MRRLLHFGVAAGLLWSFAQAPFQHSHPSDPHHEHAQGFAHTHLSEPATTGPAWEAEDHDSDARMLEWIAGDGSARAKFIAALPDSVVEPILTARVGMAPELMLRNHGPPARVNLQPRAPPA